MSQVGVIKKLGPNSFNAGHALKNKDPMIPNNANNTDREKNWVAR